MQLREDDTHAHEYIDHIERGGGTEFDRVLKEHLRRYELPGKTVKQ
ncbi:MAG: hypothetical protein K2N34_07325 [Lachnospiraceae bacterium]|nr:hypothetical protein [Lachnospiraceae bacterium]